MRPIHALLLLLALVLSGVVVGVLFLRSDGKHAPVVTADPHAISTEKGANVEQGPLDVAPDRDATAHERAKVAPVAPLASTSSVAGLRGRVVDPDAKPVAGATVYAAGDSGPIGMALDEMDTDSPWFKRVQTTTDADGRFTLQPESKTSVRIAVRAPGFAPLDAEKPFAGGSADVGNLMLDRGAVLQGHVVDAAGRGVEGAEVHRARVSSDGFSMMMGPGNSAPVLAKTDAGGNFRIDQIAVGPWELLVTSDTHPDKRAKGETERPGQVVTNLVIQLEQGYDIAGRVVGAPAEALDKLNVRALPNSGGNDISSFASARTSKVRKDGTFTISGCRQEQAYRVAARAKDREFGGSARSDSVDAKAGDRDVALQYRPETALVFTAVDADTDLPIETLNVQAGYRWLMPLMEEGTPKARTHFEGGRVRFPSLPGNGADTSTGQISIEAAGYEPYERKDLHLTAGVDNDLGKILLHRTTLVRVTVIEASTGAPIEGAKVTLNELSPQGSPRGRMVSIGYADDEGFTGSGAAHRGVTDKDGKVAVSNIPGKRATLSVRHPQHATWKSDPIDLPASGDATQIVKLLSGGTALVEVRDAAGKPVAGLAVDHQNGQDNSAMSFGGPPNDTVTDTNGQVTFAHLAAGKHLFRIRTNGGGGVSLGGGRAVFRSARMGGEDVPETAGWTSVDVIEGQSATVTLVAPAMGGLAGRVREGGKPLAGATVRVKPAGDDGPDFGFLDDGANATTSSSGEYSLAGLVAGDYTITVTHSSRAMPWSDKVSVHEGDNKRDVDLPLAIVEGRITGEDGKPMANVKVRAERARDADSKGERSFQVVMMTSDSDGEAMSFGPGGGTAPVVTDSEGRYRLRGVTPSVGLNVIASAPGAQETRSDRIELAPDQTRTGLDLVLKLGATVEVVTRRADGSKGSGCIVHARQVGDEDGSPKTQFVGSSGRVTFSGLQPGRWRFSCNQAGIDDGSGKPAIADQEVEVKVGPPSTVTFEIPS